MGEDLIRLLREPALRLLRVLAADPGPGPDFPRDWLQALREAQELPTTIAVARQRIAPP